MKVIPKHAMLTKIDNYVYITISGLTSAGGLLVPEGIFRPVVNSSGLTCFIRFI